MPVLTLNLKNQTSKLFHQKLTIPSTLAPGNYFLLAMLIPSTLNDTNSANDLLVSVSPFSVVG